MIHQFQDKKQIIQRKKIIRNIIGFGAFIILASIGFLSLTGQLFNYAGTPVWKTENFISKGLYNINYFFRSKAALSDENHNLIDEISNIRLTMIDYNILKEENAQLKELLGRIPDKNNYILGNILTKPNHSPYDTIIIDVGNNLGIRGGELVYSDGNIPIGNINKVYKNSSLVTLYTNPGQRTEGFIDGTNTSVELTGRGGGNFEMIIPIELSIEKGTIIYLPGNNLEVLGTVEEIISKPSDPFKKAILSSPVNVQNLKWVEVKKD